MKAMILCLSPEECTKLLNGDLSILVRKKFPSDYVGWVYIYCTKQKPFARRYVHNDKWGTLEYIKSDGKVVARFWCNKVETIKLPYTYFGTNKWVGGEHERTLQTETMDEKDLLKASCISEEEIYKYLNFKHSPNFCGYAIHITKLEIFDKPKEISEFKQQYDYFAKNKTCNNCPCANCNSCIATKSLTRVPQSYCYVEV